MLSIMAMISLFCLSPLFFLFVFLFYLSAKAMNYNGPQDKHIIVHIVNDKEEDDDYYEQEPEPFIRDNFHFN
jgi:hypothetical protein